MHLESFKTVSWMGGAGVCLLRRSFRLKQVPRQAVLRIIADPHTYSRDYWMENGQTEYDWTWLLGGSFLKYRIFVNGRQIGAGPFRPVRDSIPVLHKFDLTADLTAGENVLGIFSRGEQYGVKLELEIDGQTIPSGPGWRQFGMNDIHCPVCWKRQGMEQFFKGGTGPGEWPEHIDGTRYPFGWATPGFDASAWPTAVTFAVPTPEVELPETPNYVLQAVEPVSTAEYRPGHYLIDFGRECVAGLELTAPGGDVEIRLGEELLPNGRVRFQMRTENCYQELWSFPADGGTLSHFGLRAFRYAELTGLQTPPRLRAITVTAPFDATQSKFHSGDERLNRIWKLCKDTIHYTSLDVYTDCPSRERIAYEADSYIAMLTHFALECNHPLARRTLRYQMSHRTWPMEWRQFLIPLFYEYLLYSGDLELVDEYFSQLAQFNDYPDWRQGLIRTFPQRLLIDWPPSARDDYEFGDCSAVPNAFAIWNLQQTAELAVWLNRDPAPWQERAAIMKDAFNRNLKDDLYRDHPTSSHYSLHANLFAAAFGLLPPGEEAPVLDFLEQKGMVCSVYAAQFLLEALFRYQRPEAAMRLITADTPHSWLNMLKQGATCAMEAWTPEQKSNASFAHPWGAAPANVLVRHLFGIRPTAPGWREAVIAPADCDFTVSARIPTRFGPINFERQGRKTSFQAPAQINLKTEK